jgi:S-adenosylhomocysteine hydrolase
MDVLKLKLNTVVGNADMTLLQLEIKIYRFRISANEEIKLSFCNIGNFDNEIAVTGLNHGASKVEIKPR